MKREEIKNIDDFRSKLGFSLHDITIRKEKYQQVSTKIIKAFANKTTLHNTQILSCQDDLYLSKHKLAIEVDEKGHTDRDEKK